MKKIISFIAVIILVLSLSSCKGEEAVPTYLITDPDEYTEFVTYPDVDTMSPKTMQKEVPMELPFEFDVKRVRSCQAIKAEDSFMPDTYAQEIYKDGTDQYFVFSSKMAFVILTDNDDIKKSKYFYSAYYNEDGRLFYIGDDIYSWYYNDDGEVNILAYTYFFEGEEVSTTFYDPDGNRIGAVYDGGFYDAELNPLSPEEEFAFLQRLGAVAEVFKK